MFLVKTIKNVDGRSSSTSWFNSPPCALIHSQVGLMTWSGLGFILLGDIIVSWSFWWLWLVPVNYPSDRFWFSLCLLPVAKSLINSHTVVFLHTLSHLSQQQQHVDFSDFEKLTRTFMIVYWCHIAVNISWFIDLMTFSKLLFLGKINPSAISSRVLEAVRICLC